MEVFLWDLILHFSRYHNIREIFRTFLSFQQGYMMAEGLREYVHALRSDHPEFRSWLLNIALRVRDDQEYLEIHAPLAEYGGILFKSYGQATDRTVIFTMDPVTGQFMATDRKLAEHLDFVPYLKKSREELLRGEFSGRCERSQASPHAGGMVRSWGRGCPQKSGPHSARSPER